MRCEAREEMRNSEIQSVLEPAFDWSLAIRHSVKRGRGAAARVVPGSSAVTITAAAGRGLTTLAALGLGGWQPLYNAVAGEHTTIDGEVAADHKGAHGGVFLGQDIRFVGEVGLVLAAVDEDETREAAVVTVALVRRVYPTSAPAQA